MTEYLPETGASFRHNPGSALAESDSVPLALPFEDHLSTFVVHSEVVARHSVPAEAAADRETARFSGPEQAGCILWRDSAMPSHRFAVAVVTDHREVRIPIAGHP
jgi:hypothetical protein